MAPVVRNLLDRRQVMVAWYNAVTINTVASYQAFLASYDNSDFAGTANRLVDRARTRSVSNAISAFASTGSTCPCSQPTNPTLRQKRTDATPTQNTGSNSENSPGTNLAVIDPTPVTVYTDPVSIVTPPRISIPVHPKPPRGNDKPEQTTGNDKPKSTGGSNNDNPQITRGRTNDNSRIQMNNGTATNTVRSAKIEKSGPLSTSTGTGIRAASVVQRQSFGQMGMARNMSAGMPRMGFGRMGSMR